MRAHEFQRLSLNHSPHQAIFCSDCPSKTWVNSILSQIKSDSQRDQFTLLPTVQALEVYFLNGLFLWLWCISGQGSLFFLLGVETTLCKTPHFQWIYGKLSQIYEKSTNTHRLRWFFFSQNKGQLRAAVTRPCRLPTPLCHTYSEPSGHEDSPGGTQNIPYLFKNLSKLRLSDPFFGYFW